MEKRISLPEGLLNAIGAYIATKPFNEVAELIAAVRANAQEVKAEEKKEEEKKE